MKIQAAVLVGPQTEFLVDELTLEEPKAGEVLVRIGASGVCHSDYHLVTGATQHPMPVVPGHEGAGMIEVIGRGVTRVRPGDHVVLNWAPACGRCFYCRRGKPNLCDTFTGPIWAGTMLDGTTRLRWQGHAAYHFSGLSSFAEYAVVPQESCVPIRRDVPLVVAALVGCAVATGVGAAMYTAGVRPGESVVVFGCGGVGLNIVQGAALCGATPIIAIDTNPAKMELAHRFGATQALPAGDQTRQAIRDLTGGWGADHVFEAVGRPALQEEALSAARPGGTLTLVGLSPMGTGTNLPGAVIARQEKVIKGSYYGTVDPDRDFPLLLDMYAAGQLKLDELVSQKYPLAQINEAYQAMLRGDVARGVVVFAGA
ncbi:MAG: Zn-dependent alcohol dehydrogenase [Chloroflexi bacterium]|nr:Zn-dependent alcohol dehydrogenase [Chloroflexota bacterium]MCI0577693.1 Zn-dependent alcohol dehydrogenase [Chloroflexota bacterium]MCI0644587.1 Zn-dependent alcohol dehydrogenase [Chloroflexota bacterium]MCI0728237.1 Zn-dependent alcohol dehydrogenase [Chloroflexota bacterium]